MPLPVATLAEAWVNNLAANYSCKMYHPFQLGKAQPYGQNLASTDYSPSPLVYKYNNTEVVNLWNAEGADYTYAVFDSVTAGCTTGSWKDCAHFTQVLIAFCVPFMFDNGFEYSTVVMFPHAIV